MEITNPKIYVMGIIYVRGSIKTQIPGIKPAFLTSQALAGGFFTTSATWKAPSVPRVWRYYWWDQSDLWPFFLKNDFDFFFFFDFDIFKGLFKTVVTTDKKNILLRLYTGPKALLFSPLQKKVCQPLAQRYEEVCMLFQSSPGGMSLKYSLSTLWGRGELGKKDALGTG